MRLLVWLVGVAVNLVGFELAYREPSAWRWAWWFWAVAWFFAGVGLVIAGLIRAAAKRMPRPAPVSISPRVADPAPADKVE